MEYCSGDLQDDIYLPYLDDVIVFSGSFEDHAEHLLMLSMASVKSCYPEN